MSFGDTRYFIPDFVDEVKAAIVEKNRLIQQRKQYDDKYLKGKAYFSEGHTRVDCEQGLKQLQQIITIIGGIDEEIHLQDQKIISILEAKVAKVAFRIRTSDKRVNQLEEECPAQEIYVVPQATVDASSRVEITADDVWIIKAAMKTFNVGSGNIEFISLNDKDLLFKEVDAE